MSCCCSPIRATSCLFVSSRRVIMDSSVDDLSRRRCTRTGRMRRVGQVQIPTISMSFVVLSLVETVWHTHFPVRFFLGFVCFTARFLCCLFFNADDGVLEWWQFDS